jgi:hypothetical protein
MKKIRKSVFETNSSSTHSICVAEGDLSLLMDRSLIPNDKGILLISPSNKEFGWEIVDYYDAETKAYYCFLDQCTNNPENFKKLVNVIREQTGAKQVMFDYDYNADEFDYSNGYIDHQSLGTASDLFEGSDVEILRQFIFNPESYLHTDNDNH